MEVQYYSQRDSANWKNKAYFRFSRNMLYEKARLTER
jgi:hypothetical protein